MSRDTFWSRRRAAVAAEEQTEAQALQEAARAEDEARQAERSDDAVLAELDLPAPEDMDDPAQVQKLLRAAAPQRLKTRALRRLWRLNPVLANVDGLVDYGEDFTDAAMAVEAIQTVYQVGKGMLTAQDRDPPDVAEAPEKADSAATEAEYAATDTDADADTVPDAAPDSAPALSGQAPADAPDAPRHTDLPDETLIQIKRRPSRGMQFSYQSHVKGDVVP